MTDLIKASNLFTSQSAAIRWGSYSGISEICG